LFLGLRSGKGPSSTFPEEIFCTEEEVLDLLLTVDTSKATGSDGISGRMLKSTAHSIALGGYHNNGRLHLLFQSQSPQLILMILAITDPSLFSLSSASYWRDMYNLVS